MLNLFRRQTGSVNSDSSCLSGSDSYPAVSELQERDCSSTSSFEHTNIKHTSGIILRPTNSPNASFLQESSENSIDRQKDRCSVHFRSVRIRKTLSKSQYTSQEIADSWWSLTEYLALEQARNKVVKSLNKFRSPKTSTNKFQTRGLESFIQSSAVIQEQSRKEALHAVLALQEEQRRAQINDPEAIAQKYQAFSSLSQLRALHIAAHDEQEAQTMKHGNVERQQTSGSSCDSEGVIVRRTVTFNQKVKVRNIRSLDHYTQQEIKDCWYSRTESKAIMRSCVALIQAHNNATDKQSSNDCIRGLEFHAQEGARVKLEHRRNAYRSVLLVLAAERKVRHQSLQRREAVADLVAASYRRVSSQCCLEAIERALKDQIEAG